MSVFRIPLIVALEMSKEKRKIALNANSTALKNSKQTLKTIKKLDEYSNRLSLLLLLITPCYVFLTPVFSDYFDDFKIFILSI